MVFRGGLIFWADSLGSKYIHSKLEEWSSKIHGEFYKPCAYLAERAAKGAPLVRKSTYISLLADQITVSTYRYRPDPFFAG